MMLRSVPGLYDCEGGIREENLGVIETQEEFRTGGGHMCSSEGSGAGPELDGTQSSNSSTECTTPNSPDRCLKGGSFDYAESLRPGLASIIAKEPRSLTFQWASGQARPRSEESEETRSGSPQAVTYSAEIRKVDLTRTQSSLECVSAGEAGDEDNWTCVYRGSESWTQVASLSPGTCYAVRVFESVEEDDGGSSTPYCSEVAFFTTTPTTPGKPHAPLLERRHSQSLKLKWQGPMETGGMDALDYTLEMRPPPNGAACPQENEGFVMVYNGKKPAHKISNLFPGTRYCFRVKASNELGDSPWSVVSRFCTKSPVPREPIRLQAMQTVPTGHHEGQTLYFEWFKAVQEAAIPSSFSLELEDMVSGSTNIVYHGPNPFAYVSGLNAAWQYSMRVKAENQHGSSGWSFPYRFTTTAALPYAPQDPKVTEVTESTLTLEWEPPMRGQGCVVDEYMVELLPLTSANAGSKKENWELAFKGADTSCTLTGLSGGSSYKASIRAVSQVGGTGPGVFVNVKTEASMPEAPGIPYAAERETTSLVLKWSPPEEDGGEPITEYCIELRNADQLPGLEEDVEFETVYRGSLLSTEVSGLKPDSLYAIRAQAVNEKGPGPWCELTYESTRGVVPDKPSSLTASAACTSLDVAWDVPSSTKPENLSYELEILGMPALPKLLGHGSAVKPERASASSCSTFISVSTESSGEEMEELPFQPVYSGEELSYVINDLEPNTEYILRVRSRNRTGHSEWSEQSRVKTVPIAPKEPPHLVVEEIGIDCIKLEWSPADEEATRLTSLEFTVEIAERLGRRLNWTTVYKGSSTTCCATGLTCGGEYHVRIHAANDMGQGPFSKALPVQMLLPKPQKPDSPVICHRTPTTARVQWTAAMTSNGDIVKSHRLEMACEGQEMCEVYSGSSLSYQVSDLNPGTTYTFRICGSNVAGDGCWSEASQVTTPLKCPSAPVGVDVDYEASDIVLVSWDSAIVKQGFEEVWQYEVEAMKGNLQGKGKGNKNGSSQKISVTTKGNSCRLDGLRPGAVYNVRVRAIGVHKSCGRWSVPIKAQIAVEERQAAPAAAVQSGEEEVKAMNEIPSIKSKSTQHETLDYPQSSSPKIGTGSYKGRTEVRAVPKNTIRRSPQVRPRPQKKIFCYRRIVKSKMMCIVTALAAAAVAYCTFH